MADDPTRVTAQDALTRSSGRRWLIWGAVLAVVAIAVLAMLATVQAVAGITGCIVVAALYVAMVAVRFAVPGGRRRLVTLACLMGAMAVTALVVLLVAGSLARLQG